MNGNLSMNTGLFQTGRRHCNYSHLTFMVSLLGEDQQQRIIQIHGTFLMRLSTLRYRWTLTTGQKYYGTTTITIQQYKNH
jgi:hypothetical protein